MSEIIFSKFSNERAVDFNIRTEIVEDESGKKKVHKIPMESESYSHLEKMIDFYKRNGEKYSEDGIALLPCIASQNGVEFEYIEGTNLNEILLLLLESHDTTDFDRKFNRYLEFMEKQSKSDIFCVTEDMEKVFGDCGILDQKEIKVCCPANIDFIFDNILCQGDRWFCCDYEWTFDFSIPKNFIIYRSIFYLNYRSTYEEKLNQMDLYARAGISENELELYVQMEQKFQQYVEGDRTSLRRYYQKGIDIKKLVAEKIWRERELWVQVYQDCGEGISEETSYRIDVPLSRENEYYFEVVLPEKIKELRIDPGDEPLVFKLKNASKLIEQMNGKWLDEEWIYFSEKDPWMVIHISEGEDNRIVFDGQIGKVDTNTKYILDTFMKEKDRLQERLLWMEGTKSWRWTEFLRKIHDNIKKVIKRKNITEDSSETALFLGTEARTGIAVHLHLFYVDLLEEFLEYFSNIPFEFDLYISCIQGSNTTEIYNKATVALPNANKVTVKIFKNRGRDIAPFYVGFRGELMHYEYVLHVHSKKSKHIETGGSDWRRYSLDTLAGSKECVEKIFDLFRNGQNVGLIYPETHPDIPMIGYTWMGNLNQGRELLNSMGIPCRNGLFNYPAGSFFWVKMDAIRLLMERKITLEDFPEETGQIDGTLAHVLERALVHVVENAGYHSCIIDINEDAVRYDRSTKPYREYMAKDKNKIQRELEQFDSISFGLFDTLVDFMPYGKNGIVECMRDHFGFNQDFITMRLEAERIATEKFGAAMSIDDIYFELISLFPSDENTPELLKKTELELLQRNITPRKEIQEIYCNLIRQGKKISIVCDTYYPSWVIEAILVKCGFIGYEKLWVSCEYGVSKRDEQMWNLVYAEYDSGKHIHVGSDVYADWYTLERRGASSLWVMSAEEAYRLSKEYDLEDSQTTYTAEKALELGHRVKGELFYSTFGLAERDLLI